MLECFVRKVSPLPTETHRRLGLQDNYIDAIEVLYAINLTRWSFRFPQ